MCPRNAVNLEETSMPASKCKSFYPAPYGHSLKHLSRWPALKGNHCSAPLQYPSTDEDLAYRYQADLFTIIRYRASQPNHWEASFTTVNYNKHQFTKLQKIAHECTILTMLAKQLLFMHLTSNIWLHTNFFVSISHKSYISFHLWCWAQATKVLRKIFSCRTHLHSDVIFQSTS